MKITKLRTNHLENPLGYYLGQPELSWIVSEAKGKTCTGVRIQVSQDQAFEKVIYDSGRMEKADSLGFPLPVPVEEGGRYYWRVEAWDDAGDHGISETACFELAVSMHTGKWIKAPFSQKIHPLFEKKLVLREGLKKARLYITGLAYMRLISTAKRWGMNI